MTFPNDDAGARRAQMAARARDAAGEKLGQIWWAFMVRGILAAVLGLVALFWPTASIGLFLRVVGLFLLADGVTDARRSVARRRPRLWTDPRHHQPGDRRCIAFPARDVRPCRVHASWRLGSGDGVGLPVGRPPNGCARQRTQRGTHSRRRDLTWWPGVYPVAGHRRGRPGMGSRGCRADYCRPSDLGGAPIEASR